MKMTCRLSTIYLDALTVWVSFTVYNFRLSETNNNWCTKLVIIIVLFFNSVSSKSKLTIDKVKSNVGAKHGLSWVCPKNLTGNLPFIK